MFEIWKIGAAYINNLNKIMQQNNEAPRKANERPHFVQGKSMVLLSQGLQFAEFLLVFEFFWGDILEMI